MMLLMIVFTLAAVSLKGVNRERELAEPVLELQKLAKKASRSAATQRNRFVLRMLPRNVTAYQTGAKGKVVEISKVRFSPEVRFLIRPWGTKKWIEPEKGYDWVFDSSGLCEPLSVRFEMGRSFYNVEFDPLTGGVADEEMMVLD